MDCPVCKDQPMIVLELDAVEVDFCHRCSGIWLDGGELEMLLDSPAQAKELLASFAVCDNTKEEKYNCPICLKKMNKIQIGSQDAPLVIDKCVKDHGLWFDKGELPAVLEKANLDTEHKIQKLLADMFAQN